MVCGQVRQTIGTGRTRTRYGLLNWISERETTTSIVEVVKECEYGRCVYISKFSVDVLVAYNQPSFRLPNFTAATSLRIFWYSFASKC
jgi:GTP-dependent phosphoenolpyruvate carboxykinase